MLDTPNPALTARMADAIGFLVLGAVECAGEGHPGAPPGCAEIAVAFESGDQVSFPQAFSSSDQPSSPYRPFHSA